MVADRQISSRQPPLAVLHRGRSFAVIDKPAGLAVEADGPESVVKRLARELAPPGGRAWPRVVHRLDTATSGCLAVALNNAGEARLRQAFEAGEIEKTYLALVLGDPGEAGAFDTAYGPDPRDKRRHTTRIETPRRARLSWTRLRARVLDSGETISLLRVVLDTGRTHQIRVQLSEAGFPVLGDELYGEAAMPVAHAIGFARLGLHAERLELPDVDAEGASPVVCESPIPLELLAIIPA